MSSAAAERQQCAFSPIDNDSGRDTKWLEHSGIHPSGLSFILSDGEGKNASIELSEPLEEELSGTVEVIGRVTTKATIFANTFVPFREDKISFAIVMDGRGPCLARTPLPWKDRGSKCGQSITSPRTLDDSPLGGQ
ncbi:RFA3 protein, partial [Polypterus senegalus]